MRPRRRVDTSAHVALKDTGRHRSVGHAEIRWLLQPIGSQMHMVTGWVQGLCSKSLCCVLAMCPTQRGCEVTFLLVLGGHLPPAEALLDNVSRFILGKPKEIAPSQVLQLPMTESNQVAPWLRDFHLQISGDGPAWVRWSP